MDSPIEVLGELHPTVWTKQAIREEFVRVAQVPESDNITKWVDVRDPQWHKSTIIHAADIRDWHQDSGGNAEFITIWSTTDCTQVRAKNVLTKGYFEYTILPFQVVKINNRICQHKQPLIVSSDRWFARYISPYETIVF